MVADSLSDSDSRAHFALLICIIGRDESAQQRWRPKDHAKHWIVGAFPRFQARFCKPDLFTYAAVEGVHRTGDSQFTGIMYARHTLYWKPGA